VLRGHKKLKDAKVLARIEEIRGALVNRGNLTLDRMLQRLDEDRAGAIADGQWHTAVAADMGMAKLLGFWVDKKEVRGQIGVDVFAGCTSVDQLFEAVGKALPAEEAAALTLTLKHMLRRGGGDDDGRLKTIEHQAADE
jgi:hypothetical protein